jgi:hypothetical protein
MSDPFAFDDDAEVEPLDDDEEIELEDDVNEIDDPDPWAKTSSGDDDDF